MNTANATVKTVVISQDIADRLNAAFKVMHHALTIHASDNRLPAPTFNPDFTKCGMDDYKVITIMARGAYTAKLEADKAARLLPFKTAIAHATESYMTSAQRAWEQVLALPLETRETLNLRAPTTVKVHVSSFSAEWSNETDMARDLHEMGIKVVKSTKGDYIEVGYAPAPTTTQETAQAA